MEPYLMQQHTADSIPHISVVSRAGKGIITKSGYLDTVSLLDPSAGDEMWRAFVN